MASAVRQIHHWSLQALGLSEAAPVHVGGHTHEGDDNPRHDHDFWEIALVRGGQAMHETDAAPAPIEAGQVILIAPGTFHGYYRCSSLAVMNCAILPSLFRNELAWLHADARVGRVLRGHGRWQGVGAPIVLSPDASTFADCARQIEPMAVDRGRANPRPRTDAIGRVTSVLGLLAEGEAAQGGEAPPIPPVVRRAAEALETAPEHPWQMDGLAQAVHCSKAYLTRQFTAALGLPPMAYLARLRAQAAAILLRRSEMSIQAIAEQVGYPSPEHFTRRFRDHYHVTPRAYRQRHRAG